MNSLTRIPSIASSLSSSDFQVTPSVGSTSPFPSYDASGISNSDTYFQKFKKMISSQEIDRDQLIEWLNLSQRLLVQDPLNALQFFKEELCSKLSTVRRLNILHICENQDEAFQVEDLLYYSERLRQGGENGLMDADRIQEFIVKSAVFPLLKETDQPLEELKTQLKDLLEQLEFIISDLDDVNVLLPKKGVLKQIAFRLLPHDSPIEWIEAETDILHKELNEFLLASRPCRKNWSDLSSNSFYTYASNKSDSILLISYPKRIEENCFVNAVETWISKQKNSTESGVSHCFCEVGMLTKARYKLQVENRKKLVDRICLSSRYFSLISLIFNEGNKYFVKRECDYHNLAKALQSGKLSPFALLNICIDLVDAINLLANSNFSHMRLDLEDVLYFKKEKNQFLVKLDGFFALRKIPNQKQDSSFEEGISWENLNALAREKHHISLETDRYRTVMLLCEMFFLDPKKKVINDFRDWENQAIEKMKLSPDLYREILFLKEKHKGITERAFLSDILLLLDRAIEEKDIEKTALLKQVRDRITIFPYLTGLLSTTLKIDENHQKGLRDGLDLDSILGHNDPMPSYDEIRRNLLRAERDLLQFRNPIS